MIIICDNENCEHEGVPMEIIDEDSRGEWYEGIYECSYCHSKKIHRTEFDQIGLITSDKIIDGDI